MPLHVLAVSGSLRRASYNTRLLQILQERAPQDLRLERFSLADLPLYNADLEANAPPSVTLWKDKLRAADGLLVACPEYNYSVTGALKNAIDWASRPPTDSPLNGLPLGIVGVGGRFGTVRAQLHLRQIATFVNLIPMNKPEIYISNFPTPAFTAEGAVADEKTLNLLDQFLAAFMAWVQHHPKGKLSS